LHRWVRFPEADTEFWCALDLQKLLGYGKWENFSKVIDKAITSCQKAGYEPGDHFAEIRKMVVERWDFVFNISELSFDIGSCYEEQFSHF
jgi:hypothetical protein